MKTPIAALLAASAVSLMAADLPRQAPDLIVPLPGGARTSINQYRGKVVAMCFILTTCPHCQKTIGHLIQLQNEYGPRGLQVLASAIQSGAEQAVPGFVQ